MIVAKQAGFCFGVKRAVDAVYQNIEKYEHVYTYGPLIHNEAVVQRLKEAGAPYIDSLDEITETKGVAVIVRSHGVAPEMLKAIQDKGFDIIDATCPFVTRIQQKAYAASEEGRHVIIVGKADHPEVMGIKGWANGQAFAVDSVAGVEQLPALERPLVVAQTTIESAMWEQVTEEIKEHYSDAEFFMSICETTRLRQAEAAELAQKADHILVVGGKRSSNTQKLYNICSKYCKSVQLIEESNEVSLEKIKLDDIIGVVAGASTPDWMIMEVEKRMSEVEKTPIAAEETVAGAEESVLGVEQTEEVSEAEKEVKTSQEETVSAVTDEEDFLKQLNETFKTIRKGQLITGTVVQVTDDDVSLNIAYKSDGLIPRNELPIEAGQSAKDVYHVGDEIEAQVLSMNDGEGRVKLSLKRMQDRIKWQEFLDAHEEDKEYDAKIFKAVKGGVIAKVNGYEAFIPVSHLSLKYVEDVKEFVGQDVKVNIIDINRDKRRLVASLKNLLIKEAKQKKVEMIESLEKNQKIAGKVKKLTDFGAFVDVGGVDGLLHVADISWNKVKHPSDVLEEGQELEVVVLNTDPKRKRISLGLKQLQPKPWDLAAEKYLVGSTIKGKVVRITDFGAFVSLEPGIDGLVHISQVSNRRVERVEDELKLGQEIEAKVMDVKPTERKISLSIRELMEPEEREVKPKRERAERVVIPPVQEATVTLADFFPKEDE
ncbi:MAG: bifunctional 4-hydroxy-3-methylbut-2-enyl diphosphate reductase/30S ribosomal protein S1 [Eubacteriales bacterium]